MSEATEAAPIQASDAEAGADPSPETISPPQVDGEGTAPASSPEEKPEAPAADAKPAEKPEAPSDKETAYGRAVRARERKLVAEQQRFSAERDAFTREKQSIESRASEIAKREAAIAEREKMLDEDPLAYAVKVKGWRDEDLARRLLNGGQPHEREIEHRRESAWAKERDALNTKIDQLTSQIQELIIKPQQQQQARQTAEQVKAQFTTFVQQSAADMPHAARAFAADADEAIADCDAIASALRRAGMTDRSQVWRETLKRYNAKVAKLTGATAPASANADPKAAEKQAPHQGQTGDAATGGKTAPTLTGKTASQRSTIAKSDDPLLDVIDPAKGRERVFKAIDEVLAARQRTAS